MPGQSGLLSVGVFLVILALALVVYAATLIGLDMVIPLIIALYGVWIVMQAGIRIKNPEKYGRGPFSTIAMGVLLITFGGVWALIVKGLYVLPAIALLILVIGVLAVASALPQMRKK